MINLCLVLLVLNFSAIQLHPNKSTILYSLIENNNNTSIKKTAKYLIYQISRFFFKLSITVVTITKLLYVL